MLGNVVRQGLVGSVMAQAVASSGVSRTFTHAHHLVRQDTLPHQQFGSRRLMGTTVWIRDHVWLSAESPRSLSAEDRQRFVDRIERLKTHIIAANWNDTFSLVQNVPFWEQEYCSLYDCVRMNPDLLGQSETARKWIQLGSLLDFLFVCEDLRDHLNELMEYIDRTNHRFGDGKSTIKNLDEHLKFVCDRFDVLMAKYPTLKIKLEETVGQGLKQFRQRHKFPFSQEHQAYY